MTESDPLAAVEALVQQAQSKTAAALCPSLPMPDERLSRLQKAVRDTHLTKCACDTCCLLAALQTAQQELAEHSKELYAVIDRQAEKIAALTRDNQRLDSLINNPHTDDFLAAVRTEAAHQQERWKANDDAGKADADWFWLVGYLAGKALHKPEKRLHHIITTAAACLNWHAHRSGQRGMRPGIAEPTS